MKYLLISVLSFSILLACSPSKSRDKEEKSPFRTTAPSLLYFKNIRSTSYSVQEQAKTRIEKYRLNAFSSDTDRPILYPIIVNNWLEDQAYLFIEYNEFEHGIQQPITVKIGAEESIVLSPMNIQNQYDFSVQLLEALKQDLPLKIKANDGEYYTLLDNQKDKSAYMICLRDYLRLIEK